LPPVDLYLNFEKIKFEKSISKRGKNAAAKCFLHKLQLCAGPFVLIARGVFRFSNPRECGGRGQIVM
jgi:hypothetical protein